MIECMERGLNAYQSLLPDTRFSFGNNPTLADICLIPQLYSARRWGLNLRPFARLTDTEARCLDLPAFRNARPETQPDANEKTREPHE